MADINGLRIFMPRLGLLYLNSQSPYEEIKYDYSRGDAYKIVFAWNPRHGSFSIMIWLEYPPNVSLLPVMLEVIERGFRRVRF